MQQTPAPASTQTSETTTTMKVLLVLTVAMLAPEGYSSAWEARIGTGNIGALIIGTGLWGPIYYYYNKEPPQNSIGNY